MVIWFLKLVVLLGGKNFVRRTLVSSSHVVMHPRGKECSHALALSFKEKRSNCNVIAPVETPLSFNVSHTSENIERCGLVSSSGVAPN